MIEEAWIEYRDLCYPQGISGVPAKETRQAFMAGAMIIMQAAMKIAEQPEHTAIGAFGKLYEDVIETNAENIREVMKNVD